MELEGVASCELKFTEALSRKPRSGSSLAGNCGASNALSNCGNLHHKAEYIVPTKISPFGPY